MERVAVEHDTPGLAAMSAHPDTAVAELLEVIAALDRRRPQANRPGEQSIARDASSLRCRALRRIAALRDRAPQDGGDAAAASAD